MNKTPSFFALAVLLLLNQAAFAADGAKTTSSMSKLIASGQSVACDFEKEGSSGTLYIAQNKMRGDFNVSDPSAGASVIHMIHDGGFSYSWGGPFGDKQGMKMSTSGRGPGAGHGPDLEEEMDFQCRPWSADASKFEIPSDVEFMEFGGAMPMPGQIPGADMKQLQCMACDQAPEGAEREQCRQALGCA